MTTPAVRKVVQQIASIAKKTAQQQAQLVEVTVLSRNPDGSLNVSDGKGGCIRQAPKANYREGQKFKLGTEPALGQQTSLPQVSITIDASSIPCPDDGRPDCEDLVGVPCPEPPPPTEVVTSPLAAAVFSLLWVDPPPGLSYPGRSGDWLNRLGSGGALAGGPVDGQVFLDTNKEVLQQISRRTTSYTSLLIDPYADQATVAAARVFLNFDTSGIPIGSVLVSAVLRAVIKGNIDSRAHTEHSEKLRVVPSTHDGTTSTANWDKVDAVTLAEASINEIIDAGPQPLADTAYTYDLDLDLGLVDSYIIREGNSKFAIMMRLDSDDSSVLPTPGLFSTGREVTASGTPDDNIHVAAGSYAVLNTTYSDAGTYAFILDQLDGNGANLGSGGESYIAALVQPPGNNVPPVLIKGAKSLVPRRPTNSTGGIILTWVTVSCSFTNPSLISNGDIIFEPASRPFPNVGNPNEIQATTDYTLFQYVSDFVLIVTYLA